MINDQSSMEPISNVFDIDDPIHDFDDPINSAHVQEMFMEMEIIDSITERHVKIDGLFNLDDTSEQGSAMDELQDNGNNV